jgi:triosephosphate isomerase
MPANSRRPLMSGNWKMNMNHYEAIHLVQKLSYLLTKEDFEKVDVTVHPPFTDIRSIQTVLESDKLAMMLGAQNCHTEEKGAFTGEVSPAFLGKLGVKYVICGHSERRQYFGETDDIVAAKVAAVMKFDMLPIVCVGETKDEREAGTTLERVESQVKGSLKGRTADQISALVIAYEPIWAIGTGLTATAQDAQDVCHHIRSVVRTEWGSEAADKVRIQYGGSVKAGNVAELMAQPDIDGALVGGASIDPDEFARIVQFKTS